MKSRILLAMLASLAFPFRVMAQAPVCFEAEWAAGLTPPMRIVSANTVTNLGADATAMLAQASGKAYIEIPQGVGKPPATGGDATYRFDIPAPGEYTLWCRAWWEDECGNSCTMQVDDSAEFAFGQDATYRCWHWVKNPPRLPQLTLSAGPHKLTIKNREDGVHLDQVLLVKGRKYVPVDVEKITVRGPAAKP